MQKQLSYAVGWFSALGSVTSICPFSLIVLAFRFIKIRNGCSECANCMSSWQVGLPAVSYIFASQLLALIAVCNPTYVPAGWHGALMTIASATSAIVVSILIMQKLTFAEGVAIVAHCLGFVAFLVILWVLGPTADAHKTFFHFEDRNHWNSFGVATLVGIIGPISTFIGGDSAVHLAEELQDAGYVLPRAMVLGSGINYVVGAIGLISFMFNVGPLDGSIWA